MGTTHKDVAAALAAIPVSLAGGTIVRLLRREIDGGLGKEYPDAAAEMAGRLTAVAAMAGDARFCAMLGQDYDNRTMRTVAFGRVRDVQRDQRMMTRFAASSFDRIVRG